MLKLIQGHSKLVIIYLITVILTGSLLTYLGINSIKNYRELTEKRALEEQNSLINDYTDIFCHIIDSLNDQFSTSPRPDSIAIKAVEDNTGRLAKDYFITDQNGKLTEPLFTTPDYANFTASNSTFTARFKRGETAEFAGNDPGKAFSIYESCLENAGSGIDSARAYNAMARVCLKLDDEDQALKYYLTIITEHGKAVNEYGIPYPYFAMHQLINVGDTIPESLIHQFLGALLHNEIPFTAQTEDLVNGIRVNAGRTSSGGSGKIIDSLCNEALRRYDLIISYHEKLARRSFNHWQIDQTRDTLKYLTGANADHIMLIYQFDKGYLGFIVTLKALIPLVIKELNLSSFIFEYNIELINAPDALNESNGILSSYKELPASGGLKYIKISVMDPQKVDKYIFKREMLTGTGLLLMVIVIVLGFYLLLEDIRRKRKMDLMRADFVA
ncbi:MAG TPA: hypothetical protein VK994_02730, partial [Bacteroidales bacterium]|nr:hypothetical protein [Bacteroidales bacterium]